MATFKRYLPNYVLVLPFFLIYMIFTLYPLGMGFVVSFFDWRLLADNTFIGLQNYAEIFQDRTFWRSLWNTTLFVVLSTPIMVIGGFFFALIVNQPLKGGPFIRVALFAPYVLPISVIASIWGAVLSTYAGLINGVLGFFGLINEPIHWTGDPTLSWISIITITFWWTVGFNMILYWAGLQDIPDEHYEAAKIDGANAWQRLTYITIPSLRRITVLVVFLQLIASFKVFAQVYLVTGGGPAGSTRTLIQYIYEEGFQRYIMGTASAMSYVLFVIMLIIAMAQLRVMRNE